MLKLFPSTTFGGRPSAKCGEIYCHSSAEFTIVCSLCGLKAFRYEDLLMHCKKVHFDNDLLRMEEVLLEVAPYSAPMVKDELIIEDNNYDADFMEITDFGISNTENDARLRIINEEDNQDCEENFPQVPRQETVYDAGLRIINEEDNHDWDEDFSPVTRQKTEDNHDWDEDFSPVPRQKTVYDAGLSIINEEDNHDWDEDFSPVPHQEKVYDAGSRIINEEDSHDWDEEISPVPNQEKGKQINGRLIETYKCELCSRSYKGKQILRLHLEKSHNLERGKTVVIQMQKCEQCPKKFKTLRRLEDHYLTDHGGMKCTFCERRLTSRTNQLRHIETHTHGTEGRFACDYENCTKRFFKRRKYEAHKRTHLATNNFICDICGYSCGVPEMLRVHYRSHKRERPYDCEECCKPFKSKWALRQHEVTHAKPLYHHKLMHPKEKKFKCEICGQAYSQRAELDGHMRRYREDGQCCY